MDEYVGLPETHNASFRKYLKKRFLNKVEDLTRIIHKPKSEGFFNKNIRDFHI